MINWTDFHPNANFERGGGVATTPLDAKKINRKLKQSKYFNEHYTDRNHWLLSSKKLNNTILSMTKFNFINKKIIALYTTNQVVHTQRQATAELFQLQLQLWIQRTLLESAEKRKPTSDNSVNISTNEKHAILPPVDSRF